MSEYSYVKWAMIVAEIEHLLHDEVAFLAAKQQLVGQPTAELLAKLFKALSDPTRVRIISALSRRELCVSDLTAMLDMTQSAISHQLRTLREMRLVRHRRAGKHVFYRLDDAHIQDLFHRGLEHVGHD